MIFLAMIAAAFALRAYAQRRRGLAARVLAAIADAVLVGVFVFTAWFALIFTGTVRLDWLARWFGVSRLDGFLTGVVFFTPAVASAVCYLIIGLMRARLPREDDAGAPVR